MAGNIALGRQDRPRRPVGRQGTAREAFGPHGHLGDGPGVEPGFGQEPSQSAPPNRPSDPLVFASSAFVPVATMPGWLQAFARNQPVSVTIDAARALMLGGPTAQHVSKALAWCAALLVGAAGIAVHQYRKAA